MEYALTFSQYSYSLPKPLSDLVLLYMQINYRSYFEALGFTVPFYDAQSGQFDQELINGRIHQVIAAWQSKYPKLHFKTESLQLQNLLTFNSSFSTEITTLNFDAN
jgi:hypothetical protein